MPAQSSPVVDTPTPSAAAKLTKPRLRAILVRAGRQRSIDPEVDRLHGILRAQYLHHPPLVEDAFGVQALALLRQLDTASANADTLAAATVAHFEQHPDAAIITSLPGLGSLTGARVLAEIGDDRSRFANAKSLKAYAGSAPVTRASGKSLIVTHRRIKNQRLAAAGYIWAFSALRASPGARSHYDRRRTAGDRHAAAQRNLFNRLLGCLHHCLTQRQAYQEHMAFPPQREQVAPPQDSSLDTGAAQGRAAKNCRSTAFGGLTALAPA
jgi:transposase